MHWYNRVVSVITRGAFPHEFSWLIDNPVRRLFIAPEDLAGRVGVRDGDRVLEIGPGSGYFSVELARRAGSGCLVLFDLQPQMLVKARRKLDEHGRDNVDYVAGNASRGLPFPANHFDAAVLVTVLGEVPDAARCLEGIRQTLRPGGRLAVHEHLPDPDFVAFDELRTLAEAAGLTAAGRWGGRWNYTATFDKRSG
jgi:ubiquinone/menaquinone biosynthesis C-methylase UbiE